MLVALAVFDPFPGIPMSENHWRMSRWLAEEESISSHELTCLLIKIDCSCRQLAARRKPIPIRLVFARRLVRRALVFRAGLSREGRR